MQNPGKRYAFLCPKNQDRIVYLQNIILLKPVILYELMAQTKQLKLTGRIWLETEEGPVLGAGRVELLERIQQSGSLRQAALQMKMSYKQAWDMIKHMNEQLGGPVIIAQRGGKGGGNTIVTENGLKAIELFHSCQNLFLEFLKSQKPVL